MSSEVNSLPVRLAQDLDLCYREFMEKHRGEVFRYVYPYVGRDENKALDIVGEVFLRVYRTMRKCTSLEIQERATVSYLCSVAQGAIKNYKASPGDWLRLKKIDELGIPLYDSEGHMHDVEDPSAKPEQELMSKDLQREGDRAFFVCVNRLPEQYKAEREILVYRFFYDCSYWEIKQVFNISVRVAKEREKLGLQLLREILVGEKAEKKVGKMR